jgi:EAL domain-containing protein (putative c-di-GMP-specific phosphodiesterase class I)
LRGQEVFVTVSLGIAVAPQENPEPETLLRNADTAMYRAKNSGRGTYQVFDEEMRQEVLKTLQMQTALRRGFDRKEFSLAYQPIVLLQTGKVVGFEALARWKNPQGRTVMPGEFIPLAEETGLIIPIGEWVLGEAWRQLHQWRTVYPARTPLWISVNLSRRQLAHAELVSSVSRLLQESDLEPSRLMLEITESAIMKDAEDAARTLATLRAMGLRVAIDDFGTGYSSLSLLQRFPIDVVKIDRTFVAELDTSSSDGSQVLRAITSLATNLGLDVVAEGVERAEQVALLQELDCMYGQGHYFAHPQDAASAAGLLDEPSAAVDQAFILPAPSKPQTVS